MDDFQPLVKESSELMTQLSREVETLRSKLAEREALQNALKDLQTEINALQLDRIPDLMVQADIRSFTTPSGSRVTIGPIVQATWPKEEMVVEQAIHWMDDHGLSGLVSAAVTIDYGRANREAALALYEQMRQLNNAKTSFAQKVHPQTLSKAFRDMLKNGDEIDSAAMDLFAVFAGNKATIEERVASPLVRK